MLTLSADFSIFKTKENLTIFKTLINLADYNFYLTLQPDQYKDMRELFPFLKKECILFYSSDKEKVDKIKQCKSEVHYDTEELNGIENQIIMRRNSYGGRRRKSADKAGRVV